jgi:hypothetical protein
MKAKSQRTPALLAARRMALIDQCTRQREDIADEIAMLLEPLRPGVMQRVMGSKLALPLAAAGIGLGFLLRRSARTMMMISTGWSIFKLAGKLRASASKLRSTSQHD